MIINIVSLLYFVIAGLFALLLAWRVIKAKSLLEAISLAIVFVPIVLRSAQNKIMRITAGRSTI